MIYQQKTTIFLVLFLMAFKSHAVSFDCAKASTLVEKTVCSDKELSDLDDLLMQSYKNAMSNATNKKALKAAQLAWLKTRNRCQDVGCLKKAYGERTKQLNTSVVHNDIPKNVVPGRCHMNSCWWWKVENTENIQAENKGRLVKVHVKTTSADYSDAEVEKNGYPDFPLPQAQWDNTTEVFLFCSKKLPTYIEYHQDSGQFTGTVPFDQSGATSGATEGIGNLYLYVCNSGKQPVFEMSAELEFSEMILKKPTDIYNY